MHSRPVCFFVNKAFSLLTFLMIYSCLHVGYDDVMVFYSCSEANKQKIILAGDFNCPDINWEQQTATGPDREIQQELMSFHNLTQVHNQPTREGNLLDLVFVSNPTLVKSLTNVPGI
jgi:endonuclease/exonuclease/phosphatase family metal-dependent hydrolase